MAVSIELEVDRRVDIILIDHPQLVSHITLMIEEELLWRAIHAREMTVLSRHAQERRKLSIMLWSVLTKLIH